MPDTIDQQPGSALAGLLSPDTRRQYEAPPAEPTGGPAALDALLSPGTRQHFQASDFLSQHLQTAVQQDVQRWGEGRFNRDNFETPRQEYAGHDWEQVSRDLRERFPGVDPDEYRQSYEQERRAMFRQETLRRIVANYQGQGPTLDENWDYGIQRTPFVGSGVTAGLALRTNRASERIAAGTGSNADYHNLAHAMYLAEQERGRGTGEQIFDAATMMPAFAAEYATTGGVGGAARTAVGEAAARGLTRILGQRAATGAIGRVAIPTAQFLAGTGTQAAIQAPYRTLASAAQAAAPQSQFGGAEGFSVVDRGQWYSPGNLAQGYGRELIEAWTEQLGEYFPGAARAMGGQVAQTQIGQRLIAAGNSLGARWVNMVPGRTADQFRRLVESTAGQRQAARELSRSFSRATGVHDLPSEMLEERVGEVLRGLTGIDQDYGTTGNLAHGLGNGTLEMLGLRDTHGTAGQALRNAGQELMVEGASFVPFMIGMHGVAHAQAAGQRVTPTMPAQQRIDLGIQPPNFNQHQAQTPTAQQPAGVLSPVDTPLQADQTTAAAEWNQPAPAGSPPLADLINRATAPDEGPATVPTPSAPAATLTQGFGGQAGHTQQPGAPLYGNWAGREAPSVEVLRGQFENLLGQLQQQGLAPAARLEAMRRAFDQEIGKEKGRQWAQAFMEQQRWNYQLGGPGGEAAQVAEADLTATTPARPTAAPTARQQVATMEQAHLDALRQPQDAERSVRALQKDVSAGLNKRAELKQAKAQQVAARKAMAALERQLDAARVAADQESRAIASPGPQIAPAAPAPQVAIPPAETAATPQKGQNKGLPGRLEAMRARQAGLGTLATPQQEAQAPRIMPTQQGVEQPLGIPGEETTAKEQVPQRRPLEQNVQDKLRQLVEVLKQKGVATPEIQRVEQQAQTVNDLAGSDGAAAYVEEAARHVETGQTRKTKKVPAPRKLLAVVRELGGIDVMSLGGKYDTRAEFIQHGLLSAFQDKKQAPGKIAFDVMAEMLVARGYMNVPATSNAEDYLLHLLQQGALDAHADLSHQLSAEERAYHEEQAKDERTAQKAGYATQSAQGAASEGLRAGLQDGQAQGQNQETGDSAGELAGEEKAPWVGDFIPELYHPGTSRPGQLRAPAGTPSPGAAAPAGTPATGGVGPFEIIKSIERILGVPLYLAEKVSAKAAAVFKVRPEAVMVGRMYVGNAPIVMHEAAHYLDKKLNLIPANVASLPAGVLAGLRQFDYQPGRTNLLVAAKEGLAEYERMRATDQLQNLTPQQQAATDWIEQQMPREWTEKRDRVRELFRQFAQQGSVEQAARHLSTTGQEAQPAGLTKGERVIDAVTAAQEQFDDKIRNSLSPLMRLEAKLRRGGKVFAPGTEPSKVFFNLMHQAKAWAGRMWSEGVFGLRGGHFEKIGPSMAEITAGMEPGDLQAVARGLPSRAELFAIIRHVLSEEKAGRPSVDDATSQHYHAAWAEMQADPAFVARATAFADRLTSAFNASRQSLEDAGFYHQGTAARLAADKPDYVPLARVQEEGPNASASGRQQLASGLYSRKGSGEQVQSPLLSLLQRYAWTSSTLAEHLKRVSVDDAVRAQEKGQSGFRDKMVEVPRDQRMEKVSADQLRQILERAGVDPQVIDDAMAVIGDAAGSYFAPAPFPSKGDAVWVVMRNGEPVWYTVKDRALYNVLTSQDQFKNIAGILTMLFEFQGKLLKFGATTLSHGFQARNIFPTRDPLTFLRNTDMIRQVKGASDIPGFLSDLGRVGWELAKSYGDVYYNAVSKALGGKGTFWGSEFERSGGELYREHAFDPRNPQRMYEQAAGVQRAAPVRIIRSVADALRSVLEVAGAGEKGPRQLEFKHTLAKLGITQASIEQARQQSPDRDPFPLAAVVAAMDAAAEVTVPFGKYGSLTSAANRIVPFLGAHIAAMDKFYRTAKANPGKALLFTGLLIGMKILHWLMYKDEPWYEELEPHWRHNYFVVPSPTGKGLWALPSSRDPDSPLLGLVEEVLRAQSHRNPQFAGWLGQSVDQLTPPLVPPLIKAPAEVMMNRGWTGNPIVPQQAQHLPASEQFTRYQAPYLASQLTGGLLDTRRARANPFAMQSTPNLSVDQFYQQTRTLEEQRASAVRAGRKFPEQDRLDALHSFQQMLTWANLAIRGGARNVGGNPVTLPEPTPEQAQALQQWRIDVARLAQGERPLRSNPFLAMDSLPETMRQEVLRVLTSEAGHVADRRPARQTGERIDHYESRVQEWQQRQDRAERFLALTGLDRGQLQALMLEANQLQRQHRQIEGARPQSQRGTLQRIGRVVR